MKVGSYVVCKENFSSPLIVGEKYLVIGTDMENGWVDIDNNGIKTSFSSARFITLEEHRENQLNKVL
jgi:hypothetical protein